MSGPLFGYRVVELAEGVAGPYCAMLMGDAGADVVKVERAEGDRSRGWGSKTAGDFGATYLVTNRNKRGVAVNLGTPEGVAAVKRLVDHADIVIGDAGWTNHPELQPDAILERNPRVIYLNISGFGKEGPLGDYPPYGELGAQLASEANLSLGVPGAAPVRVGVDIGSTYAGIYGLSATCAALIARDRVGGQRIDVSPFGSLVAMRSTLWAAQSNPDEWWGFHLDSYMKPPDNGYHTKDSAVSFTLGRMPREQRDDLYKDYQMEWVRDDPMFALVDTDSAGSGSRYGWQVRPVWEKAFAKFSTAEVIEIGRRHGATVFEKNDYEQMINSPQVQHLGMVTAVEHPGIGPVQQLVPPWDFSDTPAEIRLPAPRLGEHSAEVLTEAGYSASEVAALRSSGALVGV